MIHECMYNKGKKANWVGYPSFLMYNFFWKKFPETQKHLKFGKSIANYYVMMSTHNKIQQYFYKSR